MFSVVLLFAVRDVGASGILEHVLTQGLADVFGDVVPADTTVLTDIESGVALSVDVPRSSRRVNALFLDVFAQSQWLFSADPERRIRTLVHITLVSDALPPNIEVSSGAIVAQEASTNNAGDQDIGFRRSRRDAKFGIWRDRLGDFSVIDKTTGLNLPEPQALAVLNALLNRGFRAELGMNGRIQGVSQHRGIALLLEVTRALSLR